MKFKSVAMHRIDINDYAATEHWYYTHRGPQLARRYGPWLDRHLSLCQTGPGLPKLFSAGKA